MKLHWVDNCDQIGNSYGYANHQRNLQHALYNIGMQFDDESPIALHVKPAIHYRKIKGKLNIVYTMYEYETLPKWWIKKLKNIDLIIVPCEHNRQLFQRYTKTPVVICPEGVDVSKYQYYERQFPKDRKFRFLWHGANNPRKGWPILIKLWDNVMRIFPEIEKHIELYMKTCANLKETEQGLFNYSNIIMDNRKISDAELVEVYQQAHAYIFPTMGEGWGLTLIEALATGLPSIYTNYSGCREYCSIDYGYPINYQLTRIISEEKIKLFKKDFVVRKFISKGAYINIETTIRAMIEIYNNYKNALIKGKKASKYIANNFSWEQSAIKLVDIINNFIGGNYGYSERYRRVM